MVYCDLEIDPVVSMSQNGFVFVSGVPVGYTIEWTFNGNIVSGQTNDTLVTSQAGVYEATITSMEGCTYSTGGFSANLGIDDNALLSWNLFPNPAKGQVTISLGNDQKMDEVQLVDVTGRIVKQWNWEESSVMILNVEEIPSGYFIIKLVNGNQSWVKRLIVE